MLRREPDAAPLVITNVPFWYAVALPGALVQGMKVGVGAAPMAKLAVKVAAVARVVVVVDRHLDQNRLVLSRKAHKAENRGPW